MKRLVKIFLFALLIFGVERLCHRATDGFALVNVYAPPGDNGKWKTADSPNPQLLKQTYHYLDCGSQSYVFVSEDGKTVFKLFKFQHMRTPPWLDFLPSKGKLGDKRAKKREILEKTFNSYALAYDQLKEETGLLFIHLSKTEHIKQKLTLTDKIGRHHTLDLDSVEFILQKRGTLAYEAITTWMEEGAKEKAEKGIRNLLTLAISRCHAGIFDKDPDFSTNFGFIDETPFQMDFGRLSPSEEEKDPQIYRPEMIRITRDFEGWIAENHPDLLNSFRKELDEIISH
ncbi:MAG: hypothetical protein KFB93_05365 [Simkaniaceae bacterium]|nr:MAG: hypothetical protein KFB93_05365 [Simkaniaceae bacterium]